MDDMRILYDHQIFSMQKYGGISRYFIELIKEFNKIGSVVPKIATKYSGNYYLSELNYPVKQINLLTGKAYENQVYYGLNMISSIAEIHKNRFDVFHPTYYGTYYSKAIKNKPVIITVHDLIHERYPEFFSNPKRNTRLKKKSFELADRIIAISENTKQDVINYFNIDPGKIKVIYHGNSLKPTALINDLQEQSSENNHYSGRYLLYVGARSGYKNFNLFFKSIIPILKKDDSLTLICAGGGAFNKEESDLIQQQGLGNRIEQIQPTDNELVMLYSNALAFVFPSLYEGFGMPILEAMDCNCPVILSNSSSFPEIAKDAAEYFDPTNTESIRASIEKVIYNDDYRQELIRCGTQRGEPFSWNMTAKKTLEVYQEAINSKK